MSPATHSIRLAAASTNIRVAAVLSTLLLFANVACAPLIAGYNQVAYENATYLKAESLLLMDEATQPYSQHAQQVDDLRVQLAKAYEYARGIPDNDVAARQWAILKDPKRDLLGGFLELWKRNGKLGETFVNEAKPLVAQAFDYIICLEVNKREATKCPEGG